MVSVIFNFSITKRYRNVRLSSVRTHLRSHGQRDCYKLVTSFTEHDGMTCIKRPMDKPTIIHPLQHTYQEKCQSHRHRLQCNPPSPQQNTPVTVARQFTCGSGGRGASCCHSSKYRGLTIKSSTAHLWPQVDVAGHAVLLRVVPTP